MGRSSIGWKRSATNNTGRIPRRNEAEQAMRPFEGWENFYVIVGSAAGALIGLQFVVLTLIAERPPLRAADAGAAFATPTIVHFATVLLLSAVVSVSWHELGTAAILWGLVGLSGIIYTVIVARRLRVQNVYQPVLARNKNPHPKPLPVGWGEGGVARPPSS